MIRPVFVSLLALCLAAGAAWATPIGDDYWITIGVAPVVAAQFQAKADDAGKAFDTFLGGGLGVGHASSFAWQFLVEGGGLPVARTGQVRVEGRIGYAYVTIGPSFGDTIAPRTLPTLGPAVSFDWPFIIGQNPRTARVHQLSVFYRLDVPIRSDAKDFQLRHQAGVRFLFDIPELRRVLGYSGSAWPGGIMNP